MDILGEGCLKHVACRVTVDGTPAEASPVEAPLIQMNATYPNPGTWHEGKPLNV